MSISHKTLSAEQNLGAESANHAQPSLGSMLRQAREAAGMSQSELAQQLNLGARIVEAMEQENTAVLPGAVYVHGYLRKWAEVLQLDEARLKQAYAHLVGESRKSDMRHVTPIEPMRIKPAGTRSFPWFKLMFFIGIIMLGFFATRYLPESWRFMESSPTTMPTPGTSSTTAPLPPPVQIPLSIPTPSPPVANKPILVPGIITGEVVKQHTPNPSPNAASNVLPSAPASSTPRNE